MKLIIDIDEKEYIEICEEPCTKLGLAIANGTPLEAQPTDTKWNQKAEDAYWKAVHKYANKEKTQPTGMRDATEEERKSVKDYVDAVSKPTGVNFNELLRDCRTCKHNTGIDCGQYPCNECNRKTLPLYEPKIAQPTDAVSRDDVDAYIAKLMSGYLYDEERTRLEEFSAYLWELPSVKPQLDPSGDSIRELIREFDNKHPALFADYMRQFNNHPIAEIIEYMWDMHDLLEDIKYRLPDSRGGEEEE